METTSVTTLVLYERTVNLLAFRFSHCPIYNVYVGCWRSIAISSLTEVVKSTEVGRRLAEMFTFFRMIRLQLSYSGRQASLWPSSVCHPFHSITSERN